MAYRRKILFNAEAKNSQVRQQKKPSEEERYKGRKGNTDEPD